MGSEPRYNIEEKSTFIYTVHLNIIAMQGHQNYIKNKTETKCNSTSLYMVVILYCYTADSANICDGHTYIGYK